MWVCKHNIGITALDQLEPSCGVQRCRVCRLDVEQARGQGEAEAGESDTRQPRLAMPPKRKAIWDHFAEVQGDPSKATCNHCSRVTRVTDRVDIITSDTAANMKALMRYLHKDGCPQTNTDRRCECFGWGACIAHVFNLVVQKDLFTGIAIHSVIEDCKSIATTYNQSNNFAAALRAAEMELMGKTEDECLVIFQECKTRWNSTYKMLKRFLELQQPIQQVILDDRWSETVPFITTAAWSLMRKLVRVLEDFDEATEALSNRSASIAEVPSTLSSISS